MKFTINKRSPWPLAQQKFGFNSPGLGIDKTILENAANRDILIFSIRTRPIEYYMCVDYAKYLVKKYKSFHVGRTGPCYFVPIREVSTSIDEAMAIMPELEKKLKTQIPNTLF